MSVGAYPEVVSTVTPRTLIADDQTDVLEALRLLLRREGHEIETAVSPAGVLDAIRSRDFDLLLLDLNYARDTTSGMEGLELIEKLHAIDEQLPIVVMTAWGNTNLAVEAMRRGACDYIEKPWDNTHLLAKLAAPLARLESGKALYASARELAEARLMQQELLQRELPQFPGLEIAVAWLPAGVVSGDSYDVTQFADGSGAVLISDAVGKGVPAALLASSVQATVRALSSEKRNPGNVLEDANAFACRRLEHGRFVSLAYLHFDARGNNVRYCNAGHPAPLVLRKDGGVERLEEGGPVLGEFPGRRFADAEVALRDDDWVVAYTDGISESRNANGDEFGELGILRLAEQRATMSAQEFSRRLVDEARRHAGGRLRDDATAVVLKVRGD